jgi:ElaB/YqjD/DUF883 family membrane-anchored ribosome-binding protein
MQNTGMQGSTYGTTAEKLTEQATSGLNRLSETAQQTLGHVSDVASQAASRLGERGREFLDMQAEAVDHARSYVREHPIAAIGIAIAIGLLISRLTSRR